MFFGSVKHLISPWKVTGVVAVPPDIVIPMVDVVETASDGEMAWVLVMPLLLLFTVAWISIVDAAPLVGVFFIAPNLPRL